MGHEITDKDGLVLNKQMAWHGLGIVVDKAPTLTAALQLANLGWEVEQRPLITRTLVNGEMVDVQVDTHVANYRCDTGDLLGIVSKSYVPVQNQYLAEFCGLLVDNGADVVQVETAGSIRGGKRVWFLMKGDAFEIGKGDLMYPYLLASNGHDGLSTVRLTPTSVRAVCSNTLHQIIPRHDSGILESSALSMRHTVNIKERIEEAKLALKNYGESTERFRSTTNDLSKSLITTKELAEYFVNCYSAEFGDIPLNPQNRKEDNARSRAMSAYESFSRRFDDEKEQAGASWWCAFNAFSGIIQHERKTRGTQDVDRVERRIESNLFGLTAERTARAFTLMCQMAS